MDFLSLQLHSDEVGQSIDASYRDYSFLLAVFYCAQQLADSAVFATLLEVFEEDVRVEEYFVHLKKVLNLVLFLKVFFEELLLCGIGIKDAAESFVAIVVLWLCCGNELLCVGNELLL